MAWRAVNVMINQTDERLSRLIDEQINRKADYQGPNKMNKWTNEQINT